MFFPISRVVLILIFAFGGGFIANGLLGEPYGYGVGVAILLIPIVSLYANINRLKNYLLSDAQISLNHGGMWGEIYFRLQKLIKSLRLQVRQVEEQHERFVQAFQASPNGIVMLDQNDQIEWCNKIAEEFLGLNFKRDAMQRINHLVRRPEFIQYLAKSNFEETLLLEQMGKKQNLALLLQMFPYAGSRHLVLIQNVTDLRKADAMRRDFVANVSHEMKTPITVMLGFLETILTLDLNKDQRQEYLEMMMSQARRMKTLVEDLLTLAKLEESSRPTSESVVEMKIIMALLKNDAEALSQGRHALDFELNTSSNILGSETELLSAFSNLVSNAIRYTPNIGSVKCTWSLNSNGCGEFSVIDTGPGIAAEHLPRLTERFYRIDQSRSRETGGTGLGLAIVKHVASRHQAQLQIASEPNKGSIFTLVFPVSRISS